MKDYAPEPGWYLDADDKIAQLVYYDSGPHWEDGWGNPWDGHEGLTLPELPLRRLIEES